MNLVELLKGSLTSGDTLGKLGSMVGADTAAVQKAVSGGIPAILSGLASSAASGDGMQKLLGALGKADASVLGKIGGMLGGGGGSVVEQGSNLLSSLLGGGTLSGIVGALSKFSGIGLDGIKKLLGFLAPPVMGGVASQFKGQAPTAAGLSQLFHEQKANIANAIPGGLSLDNIPGLSGAGAAVRQVAGAASGAAAQAASGGARLLLPLLILLAAAVGVWYFFLRPKTDVPATQPAVNLPVNVENFSKNLTGDFDKVKDALSGIKDAASAEAAIPKLKDISSSLDYLKTLWAKVPDAGKAAAKSFIKDNLGKLKDVAVKAMEIPGVGDKIKPAVDDVMAKLSAFGD